MSTYVSARARMHALAKAQTCALMSVPIDTHAALKEARRLLASASTRAVRRVAFPSSARTAMTVVADSPFAEAQRLLMEAGEGSDTPELVASASEQARALMSQAIDATEKALARASRSVITSQAIAFAESPEQDFDAVSVCEGETVTVLDMRRGHEVIYVEIHEDGSVLREHQGTQGASCQQRDREFVDFLRIAGVELEVDDEDMHGGRRDGERLILEAARRDPCSLARGGVRKCEQSPLPITPPTLWDADKAAPNQTAAEVSR